MICTTTNTIFIDHVQELCAGKNTDVATKSRAGRDVKLIITALCNIGSCVSNVCVYVRVFVFVCVFEYVLCLCCCICVHLCACKM